MKQLIILFVLFLNWSVCVAQKNEKPLFKTDTISLFKSDNIENFKSQINHKLKMFDDEINDLSKSNSKISVITYKIHFKNNEVYITDIYFLDTKNKQFIEMFDTKSYTIKPNFDDVFGLCKDGWTGTSTDNNKSIDELSNLLTSNFKKNIEIRYTYFDIANQICYKTF